MFLIAAYLVSSKIGVQKCHIIETYAPENSFYIVLLDFSLSVKAAPHECVIRTGQP